MPIYPRYLGNLIKAAALKSNKMAFVSGPRQVGKTTLAKNLLKSKENYYSWDNPEFRRKWSKNPLASLGQIEPGPIVLDELHKHNYWKRYLKSLYDEAFDRMQIVVTGSARLDLYRRGGESLLGRYLPYRLHPFSVAEKKDLPSPNSLEPRKIVHPLSDILALSGFPEPLLTGNQQKAKRWSRLRMERILYEDVRDLRSVYNLSQLQLLIDILPTRVGAPLSLNSIREDLEVAYATVREWNQLLANLYITFSIPPYSKKIARSLKTEKKLYLFDPLPIENKGTALENIVALHLLKTCNCFTDAALGHFELFYIRTREKEEIDFFITRDKKPYLLLECKSNNREIHKPLLKFARILKPPHVFQTVTIDGYDRVDAASGIRVINVEKFLSMLV